MANLAIKGHSTRGEEVIKILEMLGGKNIYNLTGAKEIWYILSNGTIEYSAYLYEEKKFTLEEFLEKFPYKVGDKVSSKYLKNLKIEKMKWEETKNMVIYKLGEMEWYHADKLQPYKAETMEEKLMPKIDFNDYCKDKYLLDLGNYEIKEENGKTYAVRKQPQYPKTYKECFNICFGNKHHIVQVVGLDGLGDNKELFESFIKLKICRDAYWKIAGAWKPNWNSVNSKKFKIYTCKNKIHTGISLINNYILAFPSEEMRDAFYENFKELIEQCKELLC